MTGTRSELVGTGYISKETRQLSRDENRIAELTQALQAMLDAYYRMTDKLPRKTLAYQLCQGAFGTVPELAAKVLR